MNNPSPRRRHSLRLLGYDYSTPGAYFVTICVQGRECLFGTIIDETMQLNQFGQIVAEAWKALPSHYPVVELDEWIVMPNHIHGIIVLKDHLLPNNHTDSQWRHALSEIVRGFKTWTARDINEIRGTEGTRLWQRNFYDHIIRNDDYLWKIRQYIENNPLQWAMDQLHPDSPSKW